MTESTNRQQKILQLVIRSHSVSFSQIFKEFSEDISERTIKRDIAELVEKEHLLASGGGRSVVYGVTPRGRLFAPLNAQIYNGIELDKRKGVLEIYVFSVWNDMPSCLFNDKELKVLASATEEYGLRSKYQNQTLQKRELERFVIEMSWKSSRIEGNTYTLLDTELLIKEGVSSKKNTKEETKMILNHKQAFDFIIENKNLFKKKLSLAVIEKIHSLLTSELLKEQGLRKGVVGITGSRYTPLSNQYQISEALQQLLQKVNVMEDTYSKALLCVLGISYIQPFTDGNKRTARMISNALLIASSLAPLSYRNIEEVAYRESLLTFYEQLSLVPMKKIFLEQYIFSAHTYTSVK